MGNFGEETGFWLRFFSVPFEFGVMSAFLSPIVATSREIKSQQCFARSKSSRTRRSGRGQGGKMGQSEQERVTLFTWKPVNLASFCPIHETDWQITSSLLPEMYILEGLSEHQI